MFTLEKMEHYADALLFIVACLPLFVIINICILLFLK